jgi:hypothetical protein
MTGISLQMQWPLTSQSHGSHVNTPLPGVSRVYPAALYWLDLLAIVSMEDESISAVLLDPGSRGADFNLNNAMADEVEVLLYFPARQI